MRFDKLTYLHTDEFDDIKEIKFAGNFEDDDEGILTVEIWLQDHTVFTMIVNNLTNEFKFATDEEEQLVLEYAEKIGVV